MMILHPATDFQQAVESQGNTGECFRGTHGFRVLYPLEVEHTPQEISQEHTFCNGRKRTHHNADLGHLPISAALQGKREPFLILEVHHFGTRKGRQVVD